MKVYQEKLEIANTGIEIIYYEILQGKAEDGLLKLSMWLGFEVMRYVEEDVTMYAGPKGKHGTIGSVGYRHGGGQTTVVMGGKDIHVERPRARAANGNGEFPLPSLGKFQSEDPINDAIMSVPGSMPIQLKGTPKMLFVQAKARSAAVLSRKWTR